MKTLEDLELERANYVANAYAHLITAGQTLTGLEYANKIVGSYDYCYHLISQDYTSCWRYIKHISKNAKGEISWTPNSTHERKAITERRHSTAVKQALKK